MRVEADKRTCEFEEQIKINKKASRMFEKKMQGKIIKKNIYFKRNVLSGT